MRWIAGHLLVLASIASACSAARPACAQTDEIQVYTGEINKPGEFSITLHDNYTLAGRIQPDYPGAIVPDHSLNGTPEFAYGVRFTGEIRPVLGLRVGPVDFIVNPILDYAFDKVRSLDFAPSERIAYNISSVWAVAGEYYSDFGPLRHFETPDQQAQSIFAVVDYNGQTERQPLDVEFGIGHGFTHGSDGAIIKMLLTHTF